MVVILICDECQLSAINPIPLCRSDLVLICVQSVKAYHTSFTHELLYLQAVC